jgi:CheY-like chemotaxis protein
MERGVEKLHILLADDDDDFWVLVRDALTGPSVELQWVQDGVELMDYLASGGHFGAEGGPLLPHLILLDLNMPGKSGREALTELSADPVLSAIPVVVLSVSKDDTDITWCYSMGASSYLVKPRSFEELSESLGILCKFWMKHSRLPMFTQEEGSRQTSWMKLLME